MAALASAVLLANEGAVQAMRFDKSMAVAGT